MRRAFGGVVAVLVSACGVQTSVPRDRAVSSLSADEAQQLCRDRNAYVKALLSVSELKTLHCNLTSYSGDDFMKADRVSACTDRFTACLATATGEELTPPCDGVRASGACSASVADVNACLSGGLEAFRPLAAKNACEDFVWKSAGLPRAAACGLEVTCVPLFE